MGSERQTALSRKVAEEAAKRLGLGADEVDRLQNGLQVTNPPQTLVLHFSYTGSDPKEAARRANALTQAYIDLRKEQWESVQGAMLKSLRNQLNPVAKQNDELSQRLKQLPDGSAADSAYAVQANLLSRITDLSSKITGLQMLDMTPGNVIRNATAPTSSDGPGLPLSLGLGGLVGVGLGLLGAWVRLIFDPAPRSAGDVARAVHGPVLGALPRGSAGALVVGRTDSRAAEEYRSIAFRLAYDERFADRRRLLVVAPAAPWSPAWRSRPTSPRPSRRPARTCCSWRPTCVLRPSPNGSMCPPPPGPAGAAPSSPPRASGPVPENSWSTRGSPGLRPRPRRAGAQRPSRADLRADDQADRRADDPTPPSGRRRPPVLAYADPSRSSTAWTGCSSSATRAPCTAPTSSASVS